jgi:hypothetical protein
VVPGTNANAERTKAPTHRGDPCRSGEGEDYDWYVTAESNARYGEPQQTTNVAYRPRMAQLGFKITF